MRLLTLLFIVSMIAVGCEPGGEAAPKPETAAAKEPATPPMMQVKPDPAEDKQIAGLRETYAGAKAAFEKDKGSAEAKAKFVAAAVELGTTVMNAQSLAPKQKYPEALKLYREALALDPTNVEAKESKDTIEAIYKSMGRPIPE